MSLIKKEYNEFIRKTLTLSKDKIIKEAFKIYFYTEIKEYFENNPNEINKDITILSLFHFYLKYDYTIGTTENIEDLVKGYKDWVWLRS